MSAVQLSALISVAGMIGSIIVSAFIAGIGWGSIKKDVQTLSRQVAKIEGMFELRLRDHTSDKD